MRSSRFISSRSVALISSAMVLGSAGFLGSAAAASATCGNTGCVSNYADVGSRSGE